jgi:hypothetical protein
VQVEPIALLANSPETGFVGVYMYCDDQATLKHLPTNMRATQIAAEAGQALQVGSWVQLPEQTPPLCDSRSDRAK